MRHFSEMTPAAERVVDAAQDLIQAHGYNGFSYDDISRVIGIKKPSIHHHFATKSDLVGTVVQRYASRFGDALDAINARHSDALGRLHAYAELFAATYERDRHLCVCGILGAEAQALSVEVAGEVQIFFQTNIDWLSVNLQAAVAQGRLRPVASAQAQAYGLLSVLEGAMLVGRGFGSDSSPALAGHTYLSNLQV